MMFDDKGGRGGSGKSDFRDEGGNDVIKGQPLTRKNNDCYLLKVTISLSTIQKDFSLQPKSDGYHSQEKM